MRAAKKGPVTKTQVAKHYRVTLRTIYRWGHAGRLIPTNTKIGTSPGWRRMPKLKAGV